MNIHRRSMIVALSIAALVAGGFVMAETKTTDEKTTDKSAEETAEGKDARDAKLEKITFGSGCFWCTEAFFSELKGVNSAVSGYSGGIVEYPTYAQV